MALRLAEAIQEIKKTLADSERTAESRFQQILEHSTGFLEAALGRTGDHSTTAVLMFLPEHEQLTFVYPSYLARGNTLPATKDSLAGRIVLEGTAQVFNDVPKQPHKEFFERIPDQKGQRRIIQKMVSAPLLNGEGKVHAVVQLSRTGETPDAAGDDFTETDAVNLGKCCKAFAPYILHAWKATGQV